MKRLLLFPYFYALYTFCGYLSNDMYLPAFLKIGRDFGVSQNHVQTTISSWFAGMCLAQFFMGPLCDRFGRRILLTLGGVLFLGATIGCALSPTLSVLLIARFVQGFAVGAIMIAGVASIHALYTDPHRATLILSTVATISVVSPMIGPLLGSYVLEIAGWPAIFWLLFLFALIPFVTVGLTMPESLRAEERHSLHPVQLARSYGALLTTRGFMARASAFGIGVSGIIVWVTASPVLLLKVYGFSTLAYGYLQMLPSGGFILGAQSVQLYLRWMSRDRLIAVGNAVALAGAFIMVVGALLFSSVVLLLLGIVVYTYGFGLSSGPLQKEAVLATERGKGMATALLYLLMAGLNTLLSLVVASISDTPLLIALIMLVLAFLVCGAFFARGRSKF